MKIMHIGGSHSLHVKDIVCELKKLGYQQTIVSYRNTKMTCQDIETYYYNYTRYNTKWWKDINLRNFMVKLLVDKRPDVVHGHSLTYACIPTWIAAELGYKTCITPWSIDSIIHERRRSKFYETKCLKTISGFLYPLSCKLFQNFYSVKLTHKQVIFRSLVDLSFKSKISADPVILAPRPTTENYYQEFLIRSIPYLRKIKNNLLVIFLIGQSRSAGLSYMNKLKKIAKQKDVLNNCIFIDKTMTRRWLVDKICDSAIVYSVAKHDSGFSGVTLQALVAGKVVVTQKTKQNEFLDGRCLRVDLNFNDIKNALLYAVSNYVSSQTFYMRKNKDLKRYDKEQMIKNLVGFYNGSLPK